MQRRGWLVTEDRERKRQGEREEEGGRGRKEAEDGWW